MRDHSTKIRSSDRHLGHFDKNLADCTETRQQRNDRECQSSVLQSNDYRIDRLVSYSATKLSQLIGKLLADNNLSHGGIIYQTTDGQKKIGDALCNVTAEINNACDLLIAQNIHPALLDTNPDHSPFDIFEQSDKYEMVPQACRFLAALRNAGFEQMFFMPLVNRQGQLFLASTARLGAPLKRSDIRLIHSYCLESLDELSEWEQQRQPTDARGILTARERECLIAAARGHTAKQTGKLLGISHSTVETHLENSRRKLGARNKLSAVLRGLCLHEILESNDFVGDR